MKREKAQERTPGRVPCPRPPTRRRRRLFPSPGAYPPAGRSPNPEEPPRRPRNRLPRRRNLNPGVTVPSDGVMVSGLSLELTPGQTAFDALSQTGLALDYSGSPSRKDVYLRGIGGLYQKDCGPSSGWGFSVNGAYPNTSCSKVALSDGDVVSFQFTDGTKLN